MRLVMTLLVRDEVDILEPVLDAHLALGVDHVIATDNGSVDGSTAILQRYRRRGRLTLIHEPSDDYRQSAWVTRMARLAAEQGADWVINADADEFWVPSTGDLRALFTSYDADVGVVQARRHNFVTRPEDGRPFLDRMRWRRTDSLTHQGQVMGPKVAHRGAVGVEVAMGNHAVTGVAGRTVEDDRLQVLHFPLRSYAQYEGKVLTGTAALERNPAFSTEVGYHWRQSEALRRSGQLEEQWASWLHDDERLAADLEGGTVVEDVRVQDLLAARAGRSSVAARLRRWSRR